MLQNSNGLDSIFTKRLDLTSGVSIVDLATGIGKTYSAMVGIVKHINKLAYNEDNNTFSINNISKKGAVVYMSNNNATVIEAFKKLQEIATEYCTGKDSISLDEFQRISCIIPSKSEVFKKYAFNAITFLESNSQDDFNRSVISTQEYKGFKKEYGKINKFRQGESKEERDIAIRSINDQDSALNRLFKQFKNKVDELLCLKIADIETSCQQYGDECSEKVLEFKYSKEHAWIEQIFPDANIYDKKVIFLTADKFFYPLSPFGESAFILYGSDILKGGSVVIDESDTVYSIFLDLAISRNSFNVGDIVTNGRMLIAALNKNIGEELGLVYENSELPDNLKKAGKKIMSKGQELKEDGSEISKKYKMYNDYKSTSELAALGENVPLFHSSETGNILFESIDKKGFLAIRPDEQMNKNYIDAIRYEDFYYNNTDGKYLNLVSFIIELVNFEREVSNHLRSMVNFNIKYRKFKKGFRSVDEDILREEAINTVLNFFDLKSHYGDRVVFAEYLKDLIAYNVINIPKSEKIDNSFFSRGFSYTELKNDETHQTKSFLERTILNTTPEKMLYHLQENSHVILISATSSLESAYNNFILKESLIRWGVDINRLSTEERELAQSILDKNTDHYDNNINIVASPIKNMRKTIKESPERYYCVKGILAELFTDNGEYPLNLFEKRTLDEIIARFQRFQPRSYYIGKMIQIISVYKGFIKNSENRAMLCVFNSKVRDFKKINDRCLDVTILQWAFELIKEKYSNDCEVKILNADASNLQYQTKEVERVVNEGGRVILQTTYPTAAKGLNLQIEIFCDKIRDLLMVPTINGFYSKTRMDIGEIYFERKTNIHMISKDMAEEDNDDYYSEYSQMAVDKIKSFVEANRLYSLRELSEEEYHERLEAVSKNSKRSSYSKYSGSIAQFYWIVQVIGRINRGGLKQKDIIIHYDGDIAELLNYDTLLDPQVMVTKELRAFIDSVIEEKDRDEEIKSKLISSVYRSVCRSNSMAVNSINNYLSKRADGNLTRYDIALWEKRRVPPAGTAFGFSSDISNFIGFEDYVQNYVRFNEPRNSYAYREKDNYKSIELRSEKEKGFQEVSLKSMRYDIALKCAETRDFLESKGYLTNIDVDTEQFNVLPSPAEFNNILKASFSEMICRYLLSLCDIDVKNIKDPEIHEDFDGVIETTGIYFDFKNYKPEEENSDRSKIIRKARNKMKKTGAKAVVFVNMYNPSGGRINVSNGNIYTVSGLLKDGDNNDTVIVDYDVINKLKREIEEIGEN